MRVAAPVLVQRNPLSVASHLAGLRTAICWALKLVWFGWITSLLLVLPVLSALQAGFAYVQCQREACEDFSNDVYRWTIIPSLLCLVALFFVGGATAKLLTIALAIIDIPFGVMILYMEGTGRELGRPKEKLIKGKNRSDE